MIDWHLKNWVQSVSLRQNPAPPLILQSPSVSGNPLMSNIIARAKKSIPLIINSIRAFDFAIFIE